jgi:ankyrin repeat protein
MNILVDACANGNLDIVKDLVKNGHNIHYQNELPLRWACYNGNIDVVKYLLSLGADLNIDNLMPLKLLFFKEKQNKETIKYIRLFIKSKKLKFKKLREIL